jgi:sigma-B regulation protein RsbU (phosphoserine phosphatase)
MEIDRRIAELTTLNRIAATLNESLDLHSALRSSMEQLVQLMGLTTGWVFLLDPNAPGGPAQLIHTADFQLPPGLAADGATALKSSGCACQDLFDSGKFKKSVNIVVCSRIEHALERGDDVRGLRIHASVPIRGRERVIGILNIASPEVHHFGDEDLQLMTVIGNQIGLAAERARLFDLTRAQRINEQAALLKLSNALVASQNTQAVVEQVVQLVAEALAADACALMLADGHGGIEFRASVGWDLAQVAEDKPKFGRQGPAGLAYLTGEPVQSENLPADSRFENPGVYSQAGMRSVLAVPVVHSGAAIGALIVNTRMPRRFDADEVRLMQLMANQAAIAIEQAHLRERALSEQRLRKELELARDIQTSFLPRRLPQRPGWEFGAHYAAAREVGGDFYDFIAIQDPAQRPAGLTGNYLDGCNLLGVVVADVSDKGVPAALFMALCRTLVRAVTIGGRSPVDAIRRANELILNDSRTDQFITVFYGALNPETGSLRFVNAGHNPPLLARRASDAIQSLYAPGTVLGLLESIRLTEAEVQIEPSDVLLLYTDGVTDALNANREEFGMERLARLLAENRYLSAEALVHAIVAALQAFVGDAEPFDDMTIVALKRVGD